MNETVVAGRGRLHLEQPGSKFIVWGDGNVPRVVTKFYSLELEKGNLLIGTAPDRQVSFTLQNCVDVFIS